jgi:hypothetical protein
MSVPPPLREVGGDDGTISVARIGRYGQYLAYLNATPIQGHEQLNGWPAYRLDHLLGEDARSDSEVAGASGLHFNGGTGSCVIDNYVTEVAAHHFHEIACLVEGGGTGSVVVAATPPSQWAQFGPLLERAIAGYSVA